MAKSEIAPNMHVFIIYFRSINQGKGGENSAMVSNMQEKHELLIKLYVSK